MDGSILPLEWSGNRTPNPLVGGALAYTTMGLAPPQRVRLYPTASAALALVALMLLVAKAYGPLLGFV